MNKGWCRHYMKCQYHHPKWDSEEHRTLQNAYNEIHNKNSWGVKKREQGQARGSGWQERDQEQGKDRWKQEERQGTAGSSGWKQGPRNTQNDQPKTYIYRDRESWHYIKLSIPDVAIDSIRKNKKGDNQDVTDLMTRIKEAATELLDRIHTNDFAV